MCGITSTDETLVALGLEYWESPRCFVVGPWPLSQYGRVAFCRGTSHASPECSGDLGPRRDCPPLRLHPGQDLLKPR